MPLQITEKDDLIALTDALEGAIEATTEKLATKGAAPYRRALEAQNARYASLLERVNEASK